MTNTLLFPRIRRMALCCLWGLMCIACGSEGGTGTPQEPEPLPEADEILLSVNTLSFAAGAGSQTVSFTANRDWKAVIASGGWCTLTFESGQAGSCTLTVTVSENPDYTDRETAVSLTAGQARKNLAVRQEGRTRTETEAGSGGNEDYTGEEMNWD